MTRDLVSARASRAVALGADRLWMRCVEDSPSYRLALSHGWTWWARTEFEGPAAVQQARPAGPPAAGAVGPPSRDLSPLRGRPGLDRGREGVPACQDGPAVSRPAGARSAGPAGPAR